MCQTAASTFGITFPLVTESPPPPLAAIPQDPLAIPSFHSNLFTPTPPMHSPLPSQTEVVVVGNGPAGILMSLLLNGYEPYYHAEPAHPHPDPILHRMLAPSSLQGARPRSLLKQDFVQLTNHIQHQLAEAGRDANPISAMFDTLAHPLLDTHRGEYPSFLEWKNPERDFKNSKLSRLAVDTPPPTPTSLESSASITTARPHLVLGRGNVGGIWADMDQDHNQTLSYNEHMELPMYSFVDFVKDHPEHGKDMDRPLRSTVSAYYRAYVQRTGIESNFSNYTTVTGIHHLKDLPDHCCCFMEPYPSFPMVNPQRQRPYGIACRECRSCRYAVLGYVDRPGKKRAKFLVRSKTVVLATGTFDQPKKLPAISAHPCAPPAQPSATIQQTFHDTRQLEEWMSRHSPSPLEKDQADIAPIVIVGTGLSAADAILLIQEKQPWRRILHIYRHFSASEPSPLRRCHRDVYPEYNSVWVKMKRHATLHNSTQCFQRRDNGECTVMGRSMGKCPACEALYQIEPVSLESVLSPLCDACAYKGLPDAAMSSFDPTTGKAVIILSNGVVATETVAAVGVFIGKQVHMGFLKGSLAQEMISAPDSNSPSGFLDMTLKRRHRRRGSDPSSRDVVAEILTPPCTPPRSPALRPAALGKKSISSQSLMLRQHPSRQDHEDKESIEGEDIEQEGEAEEDQVEGTLQSQVLTLLNPLVSDMYNFRIIPTQPSETQTQTHTFPAKPKRCTRLPCYPVRPDTQAPSLTQDTRTAPSDAASFPDSLNLVSQQPEDTKCTGAPQTRQGGGEKRVTDTVSKTAGTARKGFSLLSCISMPCSPLLGCKIVCPTLPSPPLLTLCSAISSVSAALTTPGTTTTVITTTSSSQQTLGSLTSNSSACSSTSSLSLSSLTSTAMTASCCLEREGGDDDGVEVDEDGEYDEYDMQEEEPRMDQSLYAAGAITGSKFVRYVLGNGVAIMADILRNE